MIHEVPMYRAVCDAEGCEASPQDESDFFAWAHPESALDDAVDACWYIEGDRLLCPDHAPASCEEQA